jgi:hypothetical protein
VLARRNGLTRHQVAEAPWIMPCMVIAVLNSGPARSDCAVLYVPEREPLATRCPRGLRSLTDMTEGGQKSRRPDVQGAPSRAETPLILIQAKNCMASGLDLSISRRKG